MAKISPAENRLLLACLDLYHPDAALIETCLKSSGALHHPGFYERTRQLGLKALVYYQLKRLNLIQQLPPWLQNDFEADYFKNAARNQILLSDLIGLIQTFKTKGKIDAWALKGGSFILEGLYPNSAIRSLSDIDLLVKKDQIFTAEKMLVDLGYMPSPNPPHSKDQYLRQKNHLPPYYSPNGSPVELHWCFEPFRPRAFFSAESMNQDKSRMRSQSKPFFLKKNAVPILVLSPENHLINLIIHLAKADLFTLESLIKSALDWQVLIRRYGPQLNWPTLAEEVHERHLQSLWSWGLGLLQTVNVWIPPQALLTDKEPSTFTPLKNFLYNEKPGTPTHRLIFKISWQKEKHFRRRFDLIRRILWPPTSYLAGRSRVSYGLRLMKKVFLRQRIFSLIQTRKDLIFTFQTFFLIVFLPGFRRLYSLDHLLSHLTKEVDQSSEMDLTPGKRRHIEIVDWFLGLNFMMFKPDCLTRSLVLFSVLRKEGFPVSIHLGIEPSRVMTRLKGHAWLSLADKPFLDTYQGPKVFKETYRFPQNVSTPPVSTHH